MKLGFLFVLSCFALHSFIYPSVVAAQELEEAEPDLLLQVILGRHELSDGLSAYQVQNDILLPLGELSRLLTLAIRVQPNEHSASGFILQERRGFHLDIEKATVRFGDKVEKFDPTLIKVEPDEIYVASTLLSHWFPLTMDINLSTLVLKVDPSEPLPLQQRLEREQRAEQVITAPSQDEDPGYRRLNLPYKIWEVPSIDFTTSFNLTRSELQTAGSNSYQTFLTGDLLGLQSAIFFSGDNNDAPDFRMTLGRNDPEGRLLGPLSARAFAFGSVSVPGLANVSRNSATGNGFMFSNAPLTQQFSFGQHSLQGDLPPGWDVELFFNDSLIGFQQSRSDGKYTFDDLPLIYGRNEFRLVFHGPQGQLRVEKQNFLLDRSVLEPGVFYYRVAAHEDDNGPRVGAQFDWGLIPHLSATAGAASFYLSSEQRRYLNLGLRSQWGVVFANGDVIRADDGGTLVELGLQSQIGGLRFGLTHDQLSSDFDSEVFQLNGDPIRIRDRARMDWGIPLVNGRRLPITLKTRRDRRSSGLVEFDTSLRLSAYFRRLSISNQYRWLSVDGNDSSEGAFQFGSQWNRFGLRGQINYRLGDDRDIVSAALSANKRLNRGYIVNGGITRSLTTSETRYSTGLTKTLGIFGFGIGVGYSTNGEIQVNGQFFLAMAKQPRGQGWHFDALPMADTAAISARVFLDENLNGILDVGEAPIENAKFSVNGGMYPNDTNAEGITHLSRLPVKQPVDVAIDVSTLEDPQWLPREKGVRLVLRPGKIVPLDFPVIMTSEIDGSVYLRNSRGQHGIGSIELELVDEKGKVVSNATTASDGYYIVPAVLPGKYTLRIAHASLQPFGLKDTGTHSIEVLPAADFINGIDFIVIPEQESAH